MKSKKVTALLLVVFIIAALAGCGREKEIPLDQDIVLNLFVASQAAGPAIEIVEMYKSAAPKTGIAVTFGDGDKLAAKIEAGYACDIFLCDEQSFMDWLDGSKGEDVNPNQNNCILSDTRVDLFVGPVNESYDLDHSETTFCIAGVRTTSNKQAVEKFIEFMKSDGAKEVYERYELTPVE